MYSKLQLELKGNDLSYRKSSNFHGVLMEHIDKDYADCLHENRIHPYSQYITGYGEKVIWTVNVLNDEAYENILLPLMELKEFQLKNKTDVSVLSSKLTKVTEESLLECFYYEKAEHYITLDFLTPTAFKQNGRYVFYPDFSLIYGSLMRKYRSVMELDCEIDIDTLEQLIAGSEIVKYRLRTERFPLEGIYITGYKGMLGIKLHGTDTMAAYVRMLLQFGEYSGIGIKTSLGMGAIQVGRSKTHDDGSGDKTCNRSIAP